MASIKEMTTNITKLDKFDGGNFQRWQKKMHFLLTTLKVVYVWTTPQPKEREDETLEEEQRSRAKWENDEYIYRGHILNGMSNALFDTYQTVESAKDLWDQLEARYMREDATIYLVSTIIDKLALGWKEFKHSLKHKKEDLSLEELANHLRVEEEFRKQEENKNQSVNVIVEEGQSSHGKGKYSGKGKGKYKYNAKGTKRKWDFDPDQKTKGPCWIYKGPHLKADGPKRRGPGNSRTGQMVLRKMLLLLVAMKTSLP
ncbi:hypothetical protein RND81_13G074200 [Saponaria officinalis]|uniref:Zinc finger, CCHC-type n=1 Tax=Saponaria officinalis TaxID=3572 RepID=A0AAW1GV46_SAPOF